MTTLVTASPNTSAVIMSRERLRKLLAEAYQEGWDHSGEGYNAEWPDGADKSDIWKIQQEGALDQMMKDLGA